jgi:hypothetical protein
MAKSAGRGAVVLAMVGARIALALFRASHHSVPVAFNPNSLAPKFDTVQVGSCLSIPLEDGTSFEREPRPCIPESRPERVTVRITSRQASGSLCSGGMYLRDATIPTEAWCYEPVN